jgi:Mg-chelatase subunit ChlD
VSHLIDEGTNKKGWLSRDRYLPQDFVFAFRGDHIALIDRIVLAFGKNQETRARRVIISISSEQPLDGFREVGQFTIDQKTREQTIPLEKRARFVKLRIIENFGGGYTSLDEVKLIEGETPDYQSILLEWPQQTSETRTVMSGFNIEESEFLAETEPNDTPEQSNSLELSRFTKGMISPLGESDYFHIARNASVRSVLMLEMIGRPDIRAAVQLMDENGSTIGSCEPGALTKDHNTFSWVVEDRNLLLKLTEPPASIVLIWDTSSSMKGSTDDLRRAIETFIDQIRPDDRVNLIRFSNDVEVLLDNFTIDKERLKKVARDKFKAQGGTALYEAIAEGIELLENVKGNRAIVLMTDGMDTSGKLDHVKFWELIEKKRVRLYAIGMGAGQKEYHPKLASTGERVLGHIAMALNGRSLFSPTKKELKSRYQQISDELHQPSRYYLKPTLSQGDGFISVVSTGEKIPKAFSPRLELVLDCSGSMRERKRKIDGKLKIDVAKEVMRNIIESLPDDMEVALRVYGHRIKEGRPGDCQDSQLIVPFGKLNKSRLLQQVQKIKALGTTPLAYSLENAAGDFPKGSGEKLIVLVTDGKEECGGDPAEVAQRLVREGLNVRVNVVGFALADENVKQDMRQVAEITGGYFFDAQNRQGLRASLQSALAVPFDVVDASGVQVGSGLSGQGPIQVPEGLYTVIVRGAGEPIVVPDVRIISDQCCRVEVKKEGQEIGTRILGPMAREKAQQIALSGPSVQRVVNLEKGEALGINVEDAAAGLRIAAVEAGSAGEAVGVKVGDLITHIDGEPVKIRQNFIAAIRKVSLGKRKQVTVSIRCGLEVISLAVGSKVITPVPEKTTVEKEGKKGSDPQILNAQRCLQRVGFDPGPADGLWGKKTAEALREFQKWYPHQKLAVTGQLDEQTYAALQEAETRQTRPKRSKVKSAAKFCNQCGAPLKPKANFCTKCGARVTR